MIQRYDFKRVIAHCLVEDYRWNTTYAYKLALVQVYINEPLNLGVLIHIAVLDCALLFPVSLEFSVCMMH